MYNKPAHLSYRMYCVFISRAWQMATPLLMWSTYCSLVLNHIDISSCWCVVSVDRSAFFHGQIEHPGSNFRLFSLDDDPVWVAVNTDGVYVLDMDDVVSGISAESSLIGVVQSSSGITSLCKDMIVGVGDWGVHTGTIQWVSARKT